MTVSPSGIVKCLFCAKRLAFDAEFWSLGQFTRCLLTYCKTVVLVVVVVLCLENCTVAVPQSQRSWLISCLDTCARQNVSFSGKRLDSITGFFSYYGLPYVIGQTIYIFILSFVLSSFFLFFLA